MRLPLTISQAQLAQLSQPPQARQREEMFLEMAALWQLYEEKWRARFVVTLSYEERKAFFGEVYDWGVQLPLADHAHFLAIGVLLLRAVHHGWPPEDLAMARGFVEAGPDEPEAAIKWLESAFEQ